MKDSESVPQTTTDALLDTLRARESALNAELAGEEIVVAKLMGRIEEVRDLIGAITRKKPGRKPKVAEVAESVAATTEEAEELAL